MVNARVSVGTKVRVMLRNRVRIRGRVTDMRGVRNQA